MANRFEQVDEIQPDAITLILEQRNDGQWAKVCCPTSALPALKQSMTSPDLPLKDAVASAVQLANEVKLAIVVVDRDNIWNKEWGDLYRWENEPDAAANEQA